MAPHVKLPHTLVPNGVPEAAEGYLFGFFQRVHHRRTPGGSIQSSWDFTLVK